MLRRSLLISLLLSSAAMASGDDAPNTLQIFVDHYSDNNKVVSKTAGWDWKHKWSETVSSSWSHEMDAVSGASRVIGQVSTDGHSGASKQYSKKTPGFIMELEDKWASIDGKSGASIDEIRLSESLGLQWEDHGRSLGIGVFGGVERDYTSFSPSANISWDFFDRNLTLGLSHSQFFDDFHPMPPFDQIDTGGTKRISSTTFSLAQSLTPKTLLSGNVGYTTSWGYLGHPYTPVTLSSGDIVPERLPESKSSSALAAALLQAYFLGEQMGSLRLDYRFYTDSWGLASNTVELQCTQYIVDNLTFRLRGRFYAQSANDFAREVNVGNEYYRTADIRFFKFQSYLLGGKLAGNFPESWASGWLPKRWEMKWDHLWRDTKGDRRLYQLYGADEWYAQDELLLALTYLY